MEFRNIFIENPARLYVQKGQLVVEQEQRADIPIEDISSLMIESRQVTITSAVMAELAAQGVTVFFCDYKHIPTCQILPLGSYSRQRKMLMKQIGVSKPLQKQLWQKIVKQKIYNQAKCLEILSRPKYNDLYSIAARVTSGDANNDEATAAALYFRYLFGDGFRRGDDCIENAALNYGYSILRGSISRNLVIHGLEPCLGLHHHSELNNFNLADDLIEPYRPIVDLFVASSDFVSDELTPQMKKSLFNITNYLVFQSGKKFRIMSSVGRSAASLASCIGENTSEIELPELIPLELHHYE